MYYISIEKLTAMWHEEVPAIIDRRDVIEQFGMSFRPLKSAPNVPMTTPCTYTLHVHVFISRCYNIVAK